MSSNLMGIKHYAVFTFSTTSHALKAEKVMKKREKPFMIIPTPREISASCGLAMKMTPDRLEEYMSILQDEKVHIEEIYRVEEEGRQKHLHKVDFRDK